MILTIFTPTYNRAHLLNRLYESLKKQTIRDFIWLIIDDGSKDNTFALVENWKKEANFEIRYIYQENQGMHGAHNTAYSNCSTLFNVCIDSDDYMPENAVERIIFHLKELPENYAGLVGLDADKSGNIIGTCIPEKLSNVKLNELYSLYGVKGDKKLVYRTDIVKKYPLYPLFNSENFVPLDCLYLLIDQDYYLKPVNEIFCIVEYQEDGSSRNIMKQYVKNPNGFAFSRVQRIYYGSTFKERFKSAIHLVSSAIFSKNIRWLFRTDKFYLVLLALPFGVLLSLYIKIKNLNSKL